MSAGSVTSDGFTIRVDNIIGDLEASIRAEERERCAKIAEAIDSGRGNEKEIARAIRAIV